MKFSVTILTAGLLFSTSVFAGLDYDDITEILPDIVSAIPDAKKYTGLASIIPAIEHGSSFNTAGAIQTLFSALHDFEANAQSYLASATANPSYSAFSAASASGAPTTLSSKYP